MQTEQGLRIYPNPVTDGNLTITGVSTTLNDRNWTLSGIEVEIFDMSGNRVHYVRIPPVTGYPTPVTVNVQHLPNGVYVVRIGDVSTRIVKQ